jgi:hypothetical protein
MSCDTYAWCTSRVLANYISVLAINSSGTVVSSRPTGTVSGSWGYGDFQGQTVRAKPVFVAYQPTDTEILSLLTATSSRTSFSATSTSKSPTSTSTSPIPVPDKSLSKGSKIAIGVTVPVVVLALMIATSFFWIRRRRNSQIARPGAQDGTETRQPKAELHGESAGRPRAELEGSRPLGQTNHTFLETTR